ncbi:MAG: hypothetical protein JW928_09350 [Candidatus Aureabacteria bacterium]|nr:hypothetical protein [Candidatus Auribacterota bacterium]
MIKRILIIFSVLFFAMECPGYEKALTIEKIYTAPVELTFTGYIEVNNEFTFKIHSNIPDTKEGLKATQFLKMGDILFGYQIDSLAKRTAEYTTEEGMTLQKDESFLVLTGTDKKAIKLFTNVQTKIYNACYIATLKNSDENLWVGKSFWMDNRKFVVKDITESAVTLSSGGEDMVLDAGIPAEDPGSILYFEFKESPGKDNQRNGSQ